MIWIIVALVVIVILFLLQQHGKRLNEKLHINPDTYTSGKGWDAIKSKKEAEQAERQRVKEWADAGKAFGDEKLGKSMGGALNDMAGECPECRGLVWNEAENCGHCGASLHSIKGPSKADQIEGSSPESDEIELIHKEIPNAIHKSQYLSKYRITEGQLFSAISRGELNAVWVKGAQLWVEDRPL